MYSDRINPDIDDLVIWNVFLNCIVTRILIGSMLDLWLDQTQAVSLLNPRLLSPRFRFAPDFFRVAARHSAERWEKAMQSSTNDGEM